MKKLLCLLIFPVFIISPALAEDPPLPSQHPSRKIEQDRAESEKRKADLEHKAASLQKDMEGTQKELLSVAEEIKKNEQALTELENSIVKGQAEQKEIEGRLKKDRHSIGNLILALERLNRTPPEAVLARPGAPLETAQSAMLLQNILPDIYQRAERLKQDMKKLDEIIASLEKDRAAAKETSERLSQKRAEIASLLKKRQAMYREAQSGIRQEELALKEISVRAENLRDLVSKLEERTARQEAEKRREEKEEQTVPEKTPVAAFRPTPMPKAGSGRLPVSGNIVTGFGQTDDIGAESQGVTIEARPSALVVAPMGGVVRYAGTFKNYGKLIIVEHQKDYHSLIAGLARIDTVVGQSVAAGEPLGTLPTDSSSGQGPRLYYELRQGGEPVNPARKISGL
jgi:septal ring factor EnvC (AmiA/AmiB activator)